MDQSALISISFMLTMFAAAYVFRTAKTRREAQQMELKTRVLDRMGSAREFADFIGTAEGRQFLEAVSPEPENPRLRVLSTVRAGIVLLTIGAGLTAGILLQMFPRQVDISIPAILLLSAGLGMLIAAAVSFVLARRMGMLDGPDRAGAQDRSRLG